MKNKILKGCIQSASCLLLLATVASAAQPEVPAKPEVAASASTAPVAATPAPTNPATTQPSPYIFAAGTGNFCGHAQMVRIFLNTEAGKRFQQEQQEKAKLFAAETEAQLKQKQSEEASKPAAKDAPVEEKSEVAPRNSRFPGFSLKLQSTL
jgi:hypothetical protein